MINSPLFPATTIGFAAQPSKIGAEWDVVARFPTKQVETIVGFKTEAEAMAWIGSERCMAWVNARGYA